MKPGKFKAAADASLKGLELKLESTNRDLQNIRAVLKRTNEVIRESREAIARTNVLVDGLASGVSEVSAKHQFQTKSHQK